MFYNQAKKTTDDIQKAGIEGKWSNVQTSRYNINKYWGCNVGAS